MGLVLEKKLMEEILRSGKREESYEEDMRKEN